MNQAGSNPEYSPSFITSLLTYVDIYHFNTLAQRN